MSKAKNIVINYGGLRLSLDTVCGYWKYHKNDRASECMYGITFLLRSGDKQSAQGNDEISRDNMISFLDKHFDAQWKPSLKCDVCIHKNRPKTECKTTSNTSCYAYNNHAAFEREG